MRKIKEVLRLKFEVGLGLRQIARSCSIGLGTAHEYLQRAEAAKITWPLGPEWDDDRLRRLFGGPPRSRPTVLPMPDFADLHRQRQQHPHVTQQLLWEEYRQANPDGYRYSRYVAAKFMLRLPGRARDTADFPGPIRNIERGGLGSTRLSEMPSVRATSVAEADLSSR